jgi:hypothetical protein
MRPVELGREADLIGSVKEIVGRRTMHVCGSKSEVAASFDDGGSAPNSRQ